MAWGVFGTGAVGYGWITDKDGKVISYGSKETAERMAAAQWKNFKDESQPLIRFEVRYVAGPNDDK